MDFAGTDGRRNGDLWTCSHDTVECVRWQRHGHTRSSSDGSWSRRDEASDDHGGHHSAERRDNRTKRCDNRAEYDGQSDKSRE